MGNSLKLFATACCPRHARLTFEDKKINLRVGWSVPLARLGDEGLSSQELTERIASTRAAIDKANHENYAKLVAGPWEVEERELPRLCGEGQGVKVLIHKPSTSSNSDLPLVLCVHGGGLSLGDFKDELSALMLRGPADSGMEVCWVSVDYRLAPEHQFPAPVDDVVSTFLSFLDPAMAAKYCYSPKKIGIAGVSAGGYLAVHAAKKLAEAGKMPAFVAALYPMADPHMDTSSWKKFGDSLLCPGAWIRPSWQWHLEGLDGPKPTEQHMKAASLLGVDFDGLKGLRALLVLGNSDPFLDEGSALGESLTRAGLEMEVVRADGSHVLAHLLNPDANKLVSQWWSDTLT